MTEGRYPAPRRVTFSPADLLTLTPLETARVSVLADASLESLVPLLERLGQPDRTPVEVERGTLVAYAIALQLERRLDRALSWDDAQTWDVHVDYSDLAALRLVRAEAEAQVAAAMLTGAPVAPTAAEVTLAQMAEYGRVHERARRARRAG